MHGINNVYASDVGDKITSLFTQIKRPIRGNISVLEPYSRMYDIISVTVALITKILRVRVIEIISYRPE